MEKVQNRFGSKKFTSYSETWWWLRHGLGLYGFNPKGNLVFIDGIITHIVYLDILHNNLKESTKNLGLDGNFIFLHDNDPKHTGQNMVSFSL
ncbi:hypothetical protein AVEN_32127-1 [Araneus ventricosus]|uniref:Transposable element Tc1 transposase n=1 Tax=Araneus ventricosus TaxID=182803 RepID=A0A4Y2QCQ2_ARAVE|nr:hypothetical protein AVEN_32127-1 [Araneus ventricosus]